MKNFLTIREVARDGILPESLLRRWEKAGRLPGVRSGNRFYVNVELLRQQLDAESRAAVRGEGQV